MKVEAKQEARAQQPPVKQTFRQALKTLQPTRKTPAAKAPMVKAEVEAEVKTPLSPRVLSPVTHVLSQPQTRAHAEATRLGQVRGHHGQTAQQHELTRAERGEALAEKQEGRALELLGRELLREPPAPLVPAPAAPPEGTAGSVRAAEALKLVERVETFMRSGRPGLSLTLNNSLGARAEITRVGIKEVSLTLVGRTGPVDAQVLSRVRAELARRGLRVRQLLVSA